MTKRLILGTIFILGLIYILAPGPQSINDIPPLPGSLKSDEPGDSYQNPNVAAYFSDYWREYVTGYYQRELMKRSFWGLGIPSIRLNHPPEEAFKYIKDQQRTTYLEQYFYPLRGALYVNGYEPINEQGKKFDSISIPIFIQDRFFVSKTTLKYYHAPTLYRLLVYFGSWILAAGLFKLYKKALVKA